MKSLLVFGSQILLITSLPNPSHFLVELEDDPTIKNGEFSSSSQDYDGDSTINRYEGPVTIINGAPQTPGASPMSSGGESPQNGGSCSDFHPKETCLSWAVQR